MDHVTGMSLADAADQIREDFSWLEDWEARYAHIIDLGKANPHLEPHERTEETRVRGCASQVWLVTGWDDGRLACEGYATDASVYTQIAPPGDDVRPDDTVPEIGPTLLHLRPQHPAPSLQPSTPRQARPVRPPLL